MLATLTEACQSLVGKFAKQNVKSTAVLKERNCHSLGVKMLS